MIFLKQIFSYSETQQYIHIRDELNKRLDNVTSTICLNVKLSTFIKPNQNKCSPIIDVWNQKENDAIYSESVSFVFISQSINARTHYPCLVCMYEERDKNLAIKESILRKAGIPYRILDRTTSKKSRITQCNDIVELKVRRDLVNQKQLKWITEFTSQLGNSIILIHEPSLTSIFEMSDEAIYLLIDKYRKANNISDKRNYFRVTKSLNFDGVVCTAPPNCIPLFALEYDGQHHYNENHDGFERQQQNDKLKDYICEQADLPIIRLQSDVTHDKQREFQQLAQSLGAYISRLAKWIHFDQISSPTMSFKIANFLLDEVLSLPEDSDVASNIRSLAEMIFEHSNKRVVREYIEQTKILEDHGYVGYGIYDNLNEGADIYEEGLSVTEPKKIRGQSIDLHGDGYIPYTPIFSTLWKYETHNGWIQCTLTIWPEDKELIDAGFKKLLFSEKVPVLYSNNDNKCKLDEFARSYLIRELVNQARKRLRAHVNRIKRYAHSSLSLMERTKKKFDYFQNIL